MINVQSPQPKGKLDQYKKLTKEAINLANQGRWLEAIKINQVILDSSPNDIDGLNRLGKGFSEIGQYAQAKNAFSESLSLSPSNIIAKKNLERLQHLEDAPQPKGTPKTTPHIFIEESGKSCVTNLRTWVSKETLALVSPCETLSLLVDGGSVYAITSRDVILGQLEPKLASLMIKLLHSRNKYVTAVAAIGNGQLSVIIREIYRDPTMRTTVSFPVSTNNGGDYLEFTSARPSDFDSIEPDVDASIEEKAFNQPERNRIIVNSDGDYEDEQ